MLQIFIFLLIDSVRVSKADIYDSKERKKLLKDKTTDDSATKKRKLLKEADTMHNKKKKKNVNKVKDSASNSEINDTQQQQDLIIETVGKNIMSSIKLLRDFPSNIPKLLYEKVTLLVNVDEWSVEYSEKKKKHYIRAQFAGLLGKPKIRVFAWRKPKNFYVSGGMVCIAHNFFVNNDMDMNLRKSLNDKAILVADEGIIFTDWSEKLHILLQKFITETTQTDLPANCPLSRMLLPS